MLRSATAQDLVWVYPKVDPEWIKTITLEFNIHPVTAQILASRGFTTLEDIHEYLYAKLPNLFDPQLFPDMDKAVDRIGKALEKKESILIYGDNDVDGITGTVLLTEFLRYVGANVFFYVPNRTSLKKTLLHDALDYAKETPAPFLLQLTAASPLRKRWLMLQSRALILSSQITTSQQIASPTALPL